MSIISTLGYGFNNLINDVFFSQSSTAISSADLFGHDMDDSRLDVTASDLINRISFQVCVGPFSFYVYVLTKPLRIMLKCATSYFLGEEC